MIWQKKEHQKEMDQVRVEELTKGAGAARPQSSPQRVRADGSPTISRRGELCSMIFF